MPYWARNPMLLLGGFTRSCCVVGRRWINQDLDLAVIADAVRLAKADGSDTGVIQPKILGQEFAHRAGASLSQHPILGGLAFHSDRRDHHGQPEFIGLEKLSG